MASNDISDLLIDKDLGPVSAYAMAVAAGYTGTEEQFAEDLANAGQNVQAVTEAAQQATAAASRAADAAATASAAYNTDLLAVTFDQTESYAKGQHVIYSGKYYVLPNGHDANVTWENTTKTEEKVGNEIRDLKSAIESQRQTFNIFPQGKYASQVQKGNPTTINGRTYNVLPNGEIFVTGATASAGSTYYIATTAALEGWTHFVLPAGTYRFYTNEEYSQYLNIGVRRAGESSPSFYFSRTGKIKTFDVDTVIGITIEIKAARVLPEEGLLVQPMIANVDADYGYIAPWASLANYMPQVVKTTTENETHVNRLLDAMQYEENGENWWDVNDAVFYSRSFNKRSALKHIRDIKIVTANENDIFTMTDTEMLSDGTYEIHIVANGTDLYGFVIPASASPVWQTVNKNGRSVSVLCDTEGLEYPNKYIATTESITINKKCVLVLDNTLAKSYGIPESKAVGDRLNSIDNAIAETNQSIDKISDKIDNVDPLLMLHTVKYNWSFWGTAGNPTGWVKGTFDRKTGAANSQQYYMRTLDTVDIIHSIPGARQFTVTAPEGYAIQVCEYDVNDDSFIKSYGLNDIRDEDATRSITINVEHGRNYKFALGRFANNDSSSYITDTFVNSIELLVYANYDIEDINDYYFPYIDNVVDKINEKSNEISENSFGFIFITDHHYLRNAYQSPKLIHYLLKNTGIHTVIFGGDAFQNWKDRNEQNRYVNMVYTSLESCGETDFYCVAGNHEWNDMENEHNTQAGLNAITTNRQRNHVPAMDQYGDYYFDDVVSKTRIFFLSTTIQAALPWTSILWLGNSLKDVPDGYNVMVIVHAGLLREDGVVYQKNTYMNVSKLLGAFDRSEIVELYDTASTLRGTFDYTNKNGTAICYICGHCHNDFHITKADNEHHVLVFSTTGDLYKNASGDHYSFVDEGGQTIIRNVGTIYEQAFDVIQIDPTAKKVYCTRVGAGLDREFVY